MVATTARKRLKRNTAAFSRILRRNLFLLRSAPKRADKNCLERQFAEHLEGDGIGGRLNGWYVPDNAIGLVMMGLAAVVIPTLIRRRVGGSQSTYVGFTAGVAILTIGYALRLGGALAPSWFEAFNDITILLPIDAGGYLMATAGFLSLIRDLGRAQDGARQVASDERDRAEQARLQEVKLRAILNCATEYCIIACDLDGRITSYSTGGARIFGWEAEEVVGRMNVMQLRASDRPPVFDEARGAIQAMGHFEAEVSYFRKSGEVFPALLTVTALRDADGRLEGYVGIIKDITVQKAVQNTLQHERDFVRGIIETSELCIIGISLADGRITMFNHGAELITGYRADEVLGRPYVETLIHEDERPAAFARIEAIRATPGAAVSTSERLIVTKAGESRRIAWTDNVSRDEADRPAFVVKFGRDVTAERQMQNSLQQTKADLEKANAELAHLATTDYLTGLINRRQADLLFDHEIARTRRSRKTLAVILMDMDHFKMVNDTYGHEAGDAALRHVASEMRRRLRAGDIVARYGGEEFLILLPETDVAPACRLTETLCRRIEASPLTWGDAQIQLAASFGVAVLKPGQDTHPDVLVRMADEAMYWVKHLGGNQVASWEGIHDGKVQLADAKSLSE